MSASVFACCSSSGSTRASLKQPDRICRSRRPRARIARGLEEYPYVYSAARDGQGAAVIRRGPVATEPDYRFCFQRELIVP